MTAAANLREELRLEIDLRRREALDFTPTRLRLEKRRTRKWREEMIDAAIAADFPAFRRIRLACCEFVGPTTDLDLHAAQIALTLTPKGA